MVAAPALTHRIRHRLDELADPGRAPGMQAYMKSTMPYLGVSAVPLRKACREVYAGLSWETADEFRSDVLTVWRCAAFREERYAALELAASKAARPFHDLSVLPMYEEMIVTGAWWDYVDAIATHRLWYILEREGETAKQVMREWSRDRDMWKRRSAILCQIRAKDRRDLDLLYDCIAPSIESKEFFIRKAIGWALRQYAWTDPEEVRCYVARNAERLSGLSRREALKNIGASA